MGSTYTAQATRVAGGDNWLEVAYRDHADTVFNVARAIGGRDIAGDVTHEVFLRYWRRPERFDPQRGSLGAFLTVMTRGITIDMLRTNRAREAREDGVHRSGRTGGSDGHEVALLAIQANVAACVLEALRQLKPGERDAVVMAFYGGLSYREVAVALNAPEGTIKSRIRTGLRRLAAYMEANGVDAFRA